MTYIYCRISTDKQSDESLERQEEICRQWVSEPITVVHEIGSGNNQNRPELQKILRQLQPDDYVCIRDNSRLARNMLGSLTILNTITEKGAHLICDGKVIEPDNPQDIFTFNVHSAFSDFQRSIQAEKARQGIRQVYESGDYVFCSTLFGYDLNIHGKNKIVTVIEEEAKIIQFIFEKFSSGWSVKKILSQISGLPLQRQPNFTLKKISRILHQPIYMGYYINNKEKPEDLSRCMRNVLEGLLIHSNVYPPIISEDLFWDCFEKYREVTPTHSRPWQLRWTKHALSGIIRCPDCGKGIARFEHTHCYCLEDHSFDCPSKNRVKFQEEWLERIMEICFVLVFLDGSEVSSFFSQKQQELLSDKTEIVQAIESIDKSISETNTKISRIISAIAEGIFTNEQASSQMSSLKSTLSELMERKKSLESDLLSVNEDLDTFIELSAEQIINDFIEGDRRSMYKKFIKHAYAYYDKIEVEYLNGKKFVIPRGKRHNHVTDPVTVKVLYTDNEYAYKNDEYSFVYELNKVVYNPCGVQEYDDFVKSLLDKSLSLVIQSDREGDNRW